MNDNDTSRDDLIPPTVGRPRTPESKRLAAIRRVPDASLNPRRAADAWWLDVARTTRALMEACALWLRPAANADELVPDGEGLCSRLESNREGVRDAAVRAQQASTEVAVSEADGISNEDEWSATVVAAQSAAVAAAALHAVTQVTSDFAYGPIPMATDEILDAVQLREASRRAAVAFSESGDAWDVADVGAVADLMRDCAAALDALSRLEGQRAFDLSVVCAINLPG